MINLKKDDAVADAIREILQQEALKGDQHKIDANKNNKIDAHDFKLLRGKKQDVAEGSGPKEKQKTPYRDINSPEYRTAADKQKQRMAQDKAAEPGKKMLAAKEEVEVVHEANIEPTSAKSRSHISNLSNPITNTVTHPSSGKEIGIITKQPSGEYYAHHSAAKLSHAESGTFDSKDKAHQFIRNAHAKAIKNNTLSDRWNKQKKLPQFAKEEVEQLDELSPKTLKSYAKKSEPQAISSLAAAHDKVAQHIDKTGKAPSSEKHVMKIAGKEIMHAAKRTKGLERVQNRLAKEEVEGVKLKTLSQFKEGWSEMMADVKKRAEPQPSGGSGIKQGSRYGGSKQKPEKPEDEKKK